MTEQQLWQSTLYRLRKTCERDHILCTISAAHINKLIIALDGHCYVSGIAFDRTNPSYAPTIMMIDSSKGYIAGNVTIVIHLVKDYRESTNADTLLHIAKSICLLEDTLN